MTVEKFLGKISRGRCRLGRKREVSEDWHYIYLAGVQCNVKGKVVRVDTMDVWSGVQLHIFLNSTADGGQ